MTDEPVEVFDDDDIGDPPAPEDTQDLTSEELEALLPDAYDPASPGPTKVN